MMRKRRNLAIALLQSPYNLDHSYSCLENEYNNQHKPMISFPNLGNGIKSFCSVLGEMPLKRISGACPPTHKSPSGKEFDACYMDTPSMPFIMLTDGLGGSDLKVLEILKEQFKFSSKEKQVDTSNEFESVRSQLFCTIN